MDELYLPLRLESENENENETEIVINDETDIFENSNKILVNDTAGMGKSTISKKIFLNTVKNQDYIPVFIELRQLEKQPIAKQIATKFGVNTVSPGKFLNQLPLVYLFDGMDEISAENKSYIIKEIRKFIDELDKPKILITSRLESYLSEFYDFTRYTIKPLVEKEAFSLISKYDPKGGIAKKLISGIERSHDRGLKEFLSTPLYVSLLFCAYRHKTVIPQKKHLFYSQVYEALFESHDLSKEVSFVRPKYSNLDSAEFHTFLRRLGFWCLKNGGKIEFQKDELEIVVQEIISNTNGINTSAVNFVKDLTTTVPLFIKEGSNIRWSHKSLMEYFSAMFICHDAKNKQQNLLLSLYESKDWSTYKNVFELCADIDFSSLRASVVKKVLEGYINYYESNYRDITNKRIKLIDIEERIGLSFGRDFGFNLIPSKSFEFLDENFWGDGNPDVLAVKNKCQSNCHEVSQMMTGTPTHEKGAKVLFHGICVLRRETMIVNILKYKCPELISNKNKYKENFNKAFFSSAVKNNKLYIVSDAQKETINNSKNFHIVNYWFSRFGAVALNYNGAKIELHNIKEDSSNGVDQLIGEFG